jgi:hypothetical protein
MPFVHTFSGRKYIVVPVAVEDVYHQLRVIGADLYHLDGTYVGYIEPHNIIGPLLVQLQTWAWKAKSGDRVRVVRYQRRPGGDNEHS